MVEINFKDGIKSIPSELEELNPDQYWEFLMMASMYNKRLISIEDVKTKLLSVLLGLKIDYRLYKSGIREQLDGQLDKLDGFFVSVETQEGIIYRPQTFTGKNLLPVFGKWKGPDDMLNGLSFGKFCECLELHNEIDQLMLSGQEENIDGLFREITRCLYFHPDPAEEVPVLLAIHAVTFFSTVWSMILNHPIPIHGKEIDFRIIFKSDSETKKPDDKTGWAGIAFETASSGVFGKLDEVNNTPFWDVLLYLYKCKFEYLNNKTR